MLFYEKYPILSNFIGSWFPDADFDDLSDEEVVTNFMNQAMNNKICLIKSEIDSLLEQNNIPYEEIGKEANLYFSDEKDSIDWLKNIRSLLETKTQ